MKHHHFGIECTLRSRRACPAIEHVLCQVKTKKPRDFRRLHRLLRRIEPLQKADSAWEGSCVAGVCFAEESEALSVYDTLGKRCVVGINSRFLTSPVGTIAHEFGHACTTPADFKLRAGSGCSEQQTFEMCADNYAHKWGFRKEIEDERDERLLFHFGPRPNSEITEMGPSGVQHRFRISRNFTEIYVRSETEEGKPLTRKQVHAATERFLRANIGASANRG